MHLVEITAYPDADAYTIFEVHRIKFRIHCAAGDAFTGGWLQIHPGAAQPSEDCGTERPKAMRRELCGAFECVATGANKH